MKAKLKAFVKSNHWFYKIYFYLGSFFLQLLGLFVKSDPDLILFISYGGQKYDDSPRVVYEYLLQNPIEGKRYVWAFIDPDQFPEVNNKVKVDTIKYYLTALKAGVWITNSSAARGLKFKKKETKYILFPHGMTGIKKIGKDVQSIEGTYKEAFHEDFDFIFVEGKQETDILTKAWDIPRDKFYTTGFPRNDDLIGFSNQEVSRIKKEMGIPIDKKVILYAPTFRENQRDKDFQNVLAIPFHFEEWERIFKNEYVLLVTAHYEVAKLIDHLPQNNFIFNAFKYPQINDLLKIADILISDYSSVSFDYSILCRPIFCYGYDYDKYVENRGFYNDLQTLFSHGVIKNEQELIENIKNIDYQFECSYTQHFIRDKYLASYGNAAAKVVAILRTDHVM